MLTVAALIATVVLSLGLALVALRSLETALAVLHARAARLVRLTVAVDDLRHETTQVVPAYRSAAIRARTLRRPDDGEGSR